MYSFGTAWGLQRSGNLPSFIMCLLAPGHLAALNTAGARVDVEQIGDAGAQLAASRCLHGGYTVVLQEVLEKEEEKNSAKI